ncbi:MAG: hypothetical protein M3Y27_26460 [Acidobacteriota bacterium]|nr:hypothetical protein [Acidobacteriota bacterium]
MIFIDSNIPMYLIGAAHRHETEAQVVVELLIASGQRRSILSFDADFDLWPGLNRLYSV